MTLVAAIPVSALGALIVGFFCVRLTGIYFAILSLAFGELLFYIVFSWYSFTKGDDGIQGLMAPPILKSGLAYYYFTLAVVVIAALLLWKITRSPFGYTLRMLRDNQNRTAFLGIDIRKVMLLNFVIAGAFAGLAGALWGPFQRSVSPALLGWHQSGVPVFMTLIGGAAHFAGPLVGSIIYTALNAYVTQFTTYWPLTIGLIILGMVLFLPGGLLSVLDGWLQKEEKGWDMSRSILEVRNLNKAFGGISATKDVHFDLEQGAKEAIIGPNGAGKSTFFALVSGYHRLDTGSIRFDGKEITGQKPHEIARLGISRAFQVSNIFPRLTVEENVRSAIQSS